MKNRNRTMTTLSTLSSALVVLALQSCAKTEAPETKPEAKTQTEAPKLDQNRLDNAAPAPEAASVGRAGPGAFELSENDKSATAEDRDQADRPRSLNPPVPRNNSRGAAKRRRAKPLGAAARAPTSPSPPSTFGGSGSPRDGLGMDGSKEHSSSADAKGQGKRPAAIAAVAPTPRPLMGMAGASRLTEKPHHDEDDRFSELRILENPGATQMTFRDYGVNPTVATADEAVSTFAVDVDSASYSVARSLLKSGQLPDHSAIRVEEMINAFDYAYAAPTSEPFLVQAEVFPSPNRRGYHVLHLGVKGKQLSVEERTPRMLVFVVDVSGSMSGSNRLGLVKRSLTLLTSELDARDSVGLVVYGSDAREVLAPTRVTLRGKRRILDAISGLSIEGSTNVEAGLSLAYDIAERHNTSSNNTRVVLCSDGVANVGATEASSILARVEEQKRRGVTISTVGFGMGHYNDVLMEQLADQGNGNYAYVDDIAAARTLFVDRLGATLEVIAKDVKIQMTFDPSQVDRYRLLGFENRMLDKRDFANDRVDAGEIGAGHAVTAIYEVKFKHPNPSANFGQLKVRYKAPQGSESRLIERPLPAAIVKSSYNAASAPTKLSMVVASFGEKLRGSYWSRTYSYDDVLELWKKIPESLQRRPDVAELRSLILKAEALDSRGDRFARVLPLHKIDFDRVPVLN